MRGALAAAESRNGLAAAWLGGLGLTNEGQSSSAPVLLVQVPGRMDLLVPLLILAIFLVPIAISIHRSTELFVVEISSGRTRLVRGRIPPQLLEDITVILQRSRTEGTLRVTHERREARLQASSSFSDDTLQQLRNVIGNTPLQRIRAGRPPAKLKKTHRK